jgi:hypothetical protein
MRNTSTTAKVRSSLAGFSTLAKKNQSKTKITVKTNCGVIASDVIAWLKNFGTIVGNQGFIENKNNGLKTDVFETEIILRKNVYEYLPMFGQKTVVNYPGIPSMCNRRYLDDHLLRDCNHKKRDWIA